MFMGIYYIFQADVIKSDSDYSDENHEDDGPQYDYEALGQPSEEGKSINHFK